MKRFIALSLTLVFILAALSSCAVGGLFAGSSSDAASTCLSWLAAKTGDAHARDLFLEIVRQERGHLSRLQKRLSEL